MRWRILALLFLARTGLGVQFQTMGSTGDYLIAEYGFVYATIGTLIGLFMLPGMFLAIPAGWVGRWISDKMLVAGGLGLLSLGGLIASVSDVYDGFAVGRLFCGAGFVICTLYFTKMTAEWFAGREIATAMGILVMSWPMGIALGQIAHELLAEHYGWPSAFQLASICCALGAVAVAVLYRRVEGAPEPGPVRARLSRGELILTLMAAMVWALFNAGYVVYLSFAPKTLTATGMGALEAAATISIASWCMLGSITGAGMVADRTGRPDLVFYICTVVCVLSLAAYAWPEHALISTLVFGLIGAAPAGIIMALTTQAMRPETRALGMGIFFTVYFVVITPTPGIGGWILDRTGEPYYAVLFSAALFGAGLFFYLAFRLLQRRLMLAPSG